ncbi:MAG TPA: FAD-dependent oxidoreductase [Baekduia sp.]
MKTKPAPARAVESWDYEADVVVVGYGIAGVCSALAAQERGADVLVLERGGGSEGLCGAIFYLGGGTAMQRAAGFEDTVEGMRDMLRSALGPGLPDEEKLAAYCEGSVAHYDWLVDSGVPFTTGPDEEGTDFTAQMEDGFVVIGAQEYHGYGLIWAGAEAAYPNAELAAPMPRGHIARGVPGDEDLYEGAATKALLRTADARGIKAEYNVGVERLVLDEDGAVVGVEGVRYEEPIRVRARAGVILATGGFGENPEMMTLHSPLLVEHGAQPQGHEGQDGLGIRMGQAAGANAVRMDAADVTLAMTPPITVRSGILLNRVAQRFVNEDAYFGRIGIDVMRNQDGVAFMLLDDASYLPNSSFRRPRWIAETIEELEAEAGFPAGALVATVEYYNKHAADGKDPLLHKQPKWVRPLEGPFALLDLSGNPKEGGGEGVSYVRGPGGDVIELHNLAGIVTLGGLHTNVDSEVLDPEGEPIAGLYAAGRCSAGLAVYGYCSGVSLGDSSFFGARAGRAAAARTAAVAS